MRAIFAVVAFLAIGVSAYAGVRIDVRPTPAVPQGGYAPDTVVNLEVFLVDTGNPQGQISFRGIFLDFSDSTPVGAGGLEFLGNDLNHSWDDLSFSWINPFQIGATWPMLPQVSWVYPLPTGSPLFQTTLPDNGEVMLGNTYVRVGATGGVIDVMNDDNPDPNFGARVDFGFGGAGDPVTIWRAFTGEITGGVLQLPVVPEPGTAILLISSCIAMACRRSRART